MEMRLGWDVVAVGDGDGAGTRLGHSVVFAHCSDGKQHCVQ